MRNALSALVALFALAGSALAHGGGSFRGPSGVVPPERVGHWKRGIPCACAQPACAKCGAGMLRPEDLATCDVKTEEVAAWDDVVQCRITVTIRAKEGAGRVDAWVPVPTGGLFAAVSGSVAAGEETLAGSLRPSHAAREVYLWERKRYAIDPLLVEARREGVLDVRAFPVHADRDTVIVLEGYRLLPPRAETVRLYRTGDRFLAVLAGDHGDGRGVLFLEENEVRARFPGRAALEAPFVPALESVVTGGGGAAACGATSLVAVAEGSTPPPFIGEDQWVPGQGDLPPPPPAGTDPAPPPPETAS